MSLGAHLSPVEPASLAASTVWLTKVTRLATTTVPKVSWDIQGVSRDREHGVGNGPTQSGKQNIVHFHTKH